MRQLRDLAWVVLGICECLGAQPDEELSMRHACVACHEVDIVRLGPPFLAVAAGYADVGEEGRRMLVDQILEGSAGRWGKMPMPAQGHLSEEDAQALVDWILGLVEKD